MLTSRVVPKRLAYTLSAVVVCGLLVSPATRLSSAAEAGRSGTQASPETVVLLVTSRMSASGAMPVAVRVGDQFTISLPSNQTTGFSWRLARGMNSTVLKMVGSKYVDMSGGIPGRGGNETWSFTALHRGKTTVTLEYARPWEKGVKPAKRQAFAVVVS